MFKLIKIVLLLIIGLGLAYYLGASYDLLPEAYTPKALFGENQQLKEKLLAEVKSGGSLSGIARKTYNNIYTPALPETDGETAESSEEEGSFLTKPINKAKEAVENYEEVMQEHKEAMDAL